MLVITILKVGLAITLLASKSIAGKKYCGSTVENQNSDDVFVPFKEWFKMVSDPLSKCKDDDSELHMGMYRFTLFNIRFSPDVISCCHLIFILILPIYNLLSFLLIYNSDRNTKPMPILEIVNDCSVKNARWDYSIKVSTKQTFVSSSQIYCFVTIFQNLP